MTVESPCIPPRAVPSTTSDTRTRSNLCFLPSYLIVLYKTKCSCCRFPASRFSEGGVIQILSSPISLVKLLLSAEFSVCHVRRKKTLVQE
ncbi:hypothetical protein VUR80DRAFT_2617 [Thermomyces stellatus]